MKKEKKREKEEIGRPEKWLLKAAGVVGLDLSGYTHEITDDFANHSIKRHGDPQIHGAATITNADFDFITDIVKTPDYAVIGARRKETLINAYIKTNGSITYLYFEEILISRRNKALRGKTLYKVTRLLSLDEALKKVAGNGKTNISKAWIVDSPKNVQTAGGHPGG